MKKKPEDNQEKTQTLANKLVETTKKIEISAPTKDLLTRIGTYSINYFPELLSKIYKAPIEIGNAYGAIGFAALDVLARKNTPFKRLAKLGGYLWYVGEGIYDLTLALTDRDNVWAHLGNFALDVTMVYHLGKDMASLYQKSGEDSDKDKKFGIRKDLESVVSFFKEKASILKENFKEKENKSSEKSDSDKSNNFKVKFKEYLSSFGKGIGQGVGYGMSAGYSFGKSAFEKLNENYSVYRTNKNKLAEAKKIKKEKIKHEKEEQKIKQNELTEKIKHEKEEQKIKQNELTEKIKHEKEEQKIINTGFENVSFTNKKEILEFLEIPGKNPHFMKGYEIENEYFNFKQKPIQEQMQIIQERQKKFTNAKIQTEILPWTAKILNYSTISKIKNSLKKLDKILYELEIEEKNPNRSPAMGVWLKKQENK